jgi:hypothetical protein
MSGELEGAWKVLSSHQQTEAVTAIRDPVFCSAEVKALGERHIAAIERKIAEVEAMKAALAELVRSCQGDERPDCPILDDLAGEAEAAGASRREEAVLPQRRRFPEMALDPAGRVDAGGAASYLSARRPYRVAGLG